MVVSESVRNRDEGFADIQRRLHDAYEQLSNYAQEVRRLREAERRLRSELDQTRSAHRQGMADRPSGLTLSERREADSATTDVKKPAGGTMLSGKSAVVRRVFKMCEEVARTEASVILTGETGVGKEVAARTIHALSNRHDHPFVAVNCAALPEALLESELFGHEKGAFTGAANRKPGHFEMAAGGTLLLDEVGEMPLAMQSKLLRALEQRCFPRVGGTQLIHCDIRVIAATNRDLQEEIKAGKFRSDLYYRLNVFPIHIPPLRDRIEDLPMLIDEFAAQFVKRSGIGFDGISAEAMEYLSKHAWPGNIRELRNVMERSMILAHGRAIEPKDLPAELISAVSERAEGTDAATSTGPTPTSRLEAAERSAVIEALHTNGWNKAAAARQLGISWDQLRYRIKKYGLRKSK